MSLKEPLLTAIIFAYNHEETIAKAIESVLEQKTEYPYEIWICEDCSIDNTLEICKKYAEQYPEKIKLFAQPINTFKLPREQNHVYQAFNGVDKKYFCYLDGDDYWCDEEKIQIALDVLERNPKYTIFSHDTLVKNHKDETETPLSLVSGLNKAQLGNEITLEKLLEFKLYLHASARIYRNVIDFSKYPDDIMGDSFLFYVFLDKGILYYYDKVMSVYNITGLGDWSKLSKKEQRKVNSDFYYKINRHFDYRYDVLLTEMVRKPQVLKLFKMIFKKKLGWFLWIYLGCLDKNLLSCFKKDRK